MSDSTIAQNRRARHDYDILERFEAGIVLTGTEIKSVREHRVQLVGAYARIRDDEAWLQDMHIAPYSHAGYSHHDPRRDRKLLLHRKEIRRVRELLEEKGLTLIPLSLYLKRGKAKVELGVARGRKHHDRREAIKEREQSREIARAVRRSA
ncbi:MAG: SsrA-binding protein SmpB [Dehalococcoidia bacterium]|nr:SsrA-binding protein SmpB [Chloroflexi bacterium CFX7]MCK6564669.1 SsrA-binding protein SmpB [Dehalococcoidia bacterium]NUQ55716.1 SsrA-binding protein SmpB [Dehalococcoidia bacterium]RIL02227.1 MAG: SsrA-binding protein [bacterium]